MSTDDKPIEFWIDDILNISRPYVRSAYLHEQDTEKFNGKTIHVIEYSAYEKLKAENERLTEKVSEWKQECLELDDKFKTIESKLEADNKKLPEAVEMSRDEKFKIAEYDQAARVIHLYLEEFCEESLPYPAMVADAAREAKKAYSSLKAEIEDLKRWRATDQAVSEDKDAVIGRLNAEIIDSNEFAQDQENKIAALIAENARLKFNYDYEYQKSIDYFNKGLRREAENKELREVLEFYAEIKNHQMIHDSGDGFVNTSNVDLDVGRKARSVLAKYKKDKGE